MGLLERLNRWGWATGTRIAWAMTGEELRRERRAEAIPLPAGIAGCEVYYDTQTYKFHATDCPEGGRPHPGRHCQ